MGVGVWVHTREGIHGCMHVNTRMGVGAMRLGIHGFTRGYGDKWPGGYGPAAMALRLFLGGAGVPMSLLCWCLGVTRSSAAPRLGGSESALLPPGSWVSGCLGLWVSGSLGNPFFSAWQHCFPVVVGAGVVRFVWVWCKWWGQLCFAETDFHWNGVFHWVCILLQ